MREWSDTRKKTNNFGRIAFREMYRTALRYSNLAVFHRATTLRRCHAALRNYNGDHRDALSDTRSFAAERSPAGIRGGFFAWNGGLVRSEEHTSELQSLRHLV